MLEVSQTEKNGCKLCIIEHKRQLPVKYAVLHRGASVL